METYKTLFTAGQFAKLHNINKRTLHYYDNIGLFSPEHKGENGYRYYTYLQSTTLEMILTLRELNMSIEEIDSFMKNRSEQAFLKIVENKTAEITKTINRLKDIRKLLKYKEHNLCLCSQTNIDSIDIINCDEEYLLLSKSSTGAYDESDFALLMAHSQKSYDHRLFNTSHGCMISVKKISVDDFESYECFFTKVKKNYAPSELFIKPAGNYIRAFCKGNWDKIPATYCRILQFAKEHNLLLKGYAYEEGMNEITIQNMEEYLTMITVLCE